MNKMALAITRESIVVSQNQVLQNVIQYESPHAVSIGATDDSVEWLKSVMGMGPAITAELSENNTDIILHVEPNGRWTYYGGVFYFANSADAVLFKLRWHP